MAEGSNLIKAFKNTVSLHTHSGIYPQGAVSEAPVLNARGEYSDPPISPAFSHTYAKIAALGPLREHEDSIAQRLFSMDPAVQHSSDLGWYLGLYSGYVSDPEQRIRSSSGGITTALLCELLRRGLVDGVIHMTRATNSAIFGYEISRTEDEVIAGSKTRYYPGSLFNALKEVRQIGGRYAVVGIPSFLSELRRLEEFEPELKESIVFHIGLICGHQKTANYADNLSRQVGIVPRSLIDLDFRHKEPSLPANNYSARFIYTDGSDIKEKVVLGKDLYGTNWGWSMFKSNFSDFSDDAFNETADVVFGDAWLPQFTVDYRGTNVVVVRNSVIHEVLKDLKHREQVLLEPLSEDLMIRSQTALIRHARRERNYRVGFMRRKGAAIPLLRAIETPRIRVGRRIIQRLRASISMRSHYHYVKAIQKGNWEMYRRRMQIQTFTYRIVDKLDRIFSR